MAQSRDPLIPATPSQEAYETREAQAAAEDIFALDEPFALFAQWLEAAKASEPNDPNAVALATADETGLPDVRMVLLKGFDARGFVIYTNTESAKGRHLAANPQAALCFHWKSLRRQVRVRGPVAPVAAEEADAYFASRARDSRIGAWASDQSRPLEGRFALETRIAKFAAKYAVGDIPRPEHWSGYRLSPRRIEFWRDRAFRLHDRLEFTRADDGAAWAQERLYP
ncbi:MAG: pyridoxamine 5'-phosphate oxidase [Maricaulaceae bacterium]